MTPIPPDAATDPVRVRRAAVCVMAAELAFQANQRRRWWRKPVSPLDFIPVARDLIDSLRSAGLTVCEEVQL